MKKPPVIDDPFCLQLSEKLVGLVQGWSSIPLEKRAEMMKLVAGLSIVFHMASGAPFPERDQLNYVLRSQLGSGYSWYSCMQFLSDKGREQSSQSSKIDLGRLEGHPSCVSQIMFCLICRTIFIKSSRHDSRPVAAENWRQPCTGR